MSIYADVEKGVDMLWANNLEEAEKWFVAGASNNPRYALHYGEVAFFKGILSEFAADRQEAISRLEKAIALAEEHIKSYDQDIVPKGVNIDDSQIPNYSLDARIVAADGYTILATLQFMEEARIKGMLNMRRGWKLYQSCSAKLEKSGADQVVQDALKFGAGLFFFLISMIPPGMAQRAAALAGFRGGDRELGLQYLREAHAAKSVRSILAGLVLSLNHLFLGLQFEDEPASDSLKEVHEITHEGLQKYPTGSLFHIFAAVANLEKNNPERAKEHVEAALNNAKTIVSVKPPVIMRVLINCYAMSFDWKGAAEVMETIAEQEKHAKSKYSWSASWNGIRLGAVYMQLQDSVKSKAHFEAVLKEKASENWTQHLRQQAVKFLRTEGHFAMWELMYLTGHFEKALRSSDEKRKKVLSILDNLANVAPGAKVQLANAQRPVQKSRFAIFSRADPHNNPEGDNRGAYLVLKGAVLFTLKQYQQCEECTTEILHNQDVFANDQLYVMMALILHARCIAPTRKAEAIGHLETAMKLRGVVWENPLKAKARNLLGKYGVTEIVGSDAELDKDQVDKLIKEEELEEEAELEDK